MPATDPASSKRSNLAHVPSPPSLQLCPDGRWEARLEDHEDGQPGRAISESQSALQSISPLASEGETSSSQCPGGSLRKARGSGGPRALPRCGPTVKVRSYTARRETHSLKGLQRSPSLDLTTANLSTSLKLRPVAGRKMARPSSERLLKAMSCRRPPGDSFQCHLPLDAAGAASTTNGMAVVIITSCTCSLEYDA